MPRPSLLFRRLVLGGALLAALAVAGLPHPSAVRAAVAYPPVVVAQDRTTSKEIADAIRDATREAQREIAREAQKAAESAAAAVREAQEEARQAAAAEEKGINVNIDGTERHYASFEDFLERAPQLAALVAAIVFIVFLTPILIVALVIWYKIRKSRMHNETMLQLAERGVVPSAEALQSVASGRVDANIVRAASALPPAEQMEVLTRRAAWSDLRKGIVMGTIGLALSVHGMVDDGQPGWVGLVLLFVGLGYVALWYFEDRQAAVTMNALRPSAPPPARGSGFE